MSGDTILVRLEAVGQRRFRRDMKVSTRAVAGLTKAHVRASKASRKHARENKKLSSGLKVLGMVAGRAGGPQGMKLLAQAMQSATVAAAALTAAVGGLASALGALESAAASAFRTMADGASQAANRLRELTGLLASAFTASAVRGATATLSGVVSVLQRVRVMVLGLAPAFAAAGRSASVSMVSVGEVLAGPGAGAGLLPPTPAGTGAPAGPAASSGAGGKTNAFSLLGPSTSKLGEVPSAVVPFAGLLTASVDEINAAALPGLIVGMQALNDAFQAIVDSGALQILGEALGTVYAVGGGAIKAVAADLQKFGAMKPLVLGLAAAFLVWKAALFQLTLASKWNTVVTTLATIAQRNLNGAMRANVIGLVVAAIAVLVAGVIYAYNKFEWFRNIVNGAWEILKGIGTWIAENWQMILQGFVTAITTAVTWISDGFTNIKNTVVGVLQGIGTWIAENWQTILIALTGPLGAVIVLVVNNFDRIKSAVSGVFTRVKTVFSNIVTFISEMPSKIGEVASGLWDGLLYAAKAAFNGIAGLWNNTVGKLSISIPGWVPFMGGKTFEMPTIPTFDLDSGGKAGAGAQIPGAPDLNSIGKAGTDAFTGDVTKKALGGAIPGGPPFDDRVPSLLTPGEHVWTRGEVKAAGGHRAVSDLRRTVGRGPGTSPAAPRYVSVEAPVQVRIGEGVLADAMANVHLKLQAGIPT